MSLWYFTFFVCLCISSVITQDSVVISQKSSNRTKCGSTFTLRCDYTGSSTPCCSGTPRVWRKDQSTIIMNDGIEIPAIGKYTEKTATNYFTLTINDVKESDLGSSYSCSYAASAPSAITLSKDIIYCPPCWDIFGICIGWGTLGVVIFTALTIIVAYLIGKLQEYTPKQNAILAATTALISIILVILLSLIGAFLCIEEKETPWFILAGLIAVPVFLILLCFIWPKLFEKKGNNGRDGDGGVGGHQPRFACCNGNKVCVSSDVDENSRSLPNKGKEGKSKVTKKKPEKEGKSKHVGTENDGKRAFSAEERVFTTPKNQDKHQRPLPELQMSRPLPQPVLLDQKPRGNQLPPLSTDTVETTEKKKKKKRKPKSVEDNKAYDED